MQAIVTKFISPTDHRPSRIKATCQARTLTLSWDHALSPSGNHIVAAQRLASDLGWHGRWISADLPDGSSVWALDDVRRAVDAFTIAERPPAEIPDLADLIEAGIIKTAAE